MDLVENRSNEIFLFNLKTNSVSKKSWKTYNGALKNAKEYEIPMTEDGIDWCQRHPEWAVKRLGDKHD